MPAGLRRLLPSVVPRCCDEILEMPWRLSQSPRVVKMMEIFLIPLHKPDPEEQDFYLHIDKSTCILGFPAIPPHGAMLSSALS